jgi:ribosomal protein S18 acetylase RimI-like enzyme
MEESSAPGQHRRPATNEQARHEPLTSSGPLIPVDLASVERVALLLARAFENDPLMIYAQTDRDRRRRLLPWLIGLNVRYCCHYGEVYSTADAAGAALWLPPDGTTMTIQRMARTGVFTVPLRVSWPTLWRLAIAGDHSEKLHRRLAPMPHWYLSQIGVEPGRQGQGVGSQLLRPMLARVDAVQHWCYLETANGANLAFYQKHGFRVVGASEPVWRTPQIWSMLRAPGGTPANP